jgi:hypothetical protein
MSTPRNRAQQPQRDPRVEANLIAKRFHEKHEFLFAGAKHRDPVDWDAMPESYRRRLRGTFEAMLRAGVVAPGVVIGFTADDE